MGDMLNFVYDDSHIFEWWGLSQPNTGIVGENSDWHPWSKSWVPGAQFVDILILGSGAGGNAGATKAVGVGGAGGTGGGGGGTSRGRFLLASLPDTIYICLPRGSDSGNNSGAVFIALKPTNGVAIDLLMYTSVATASGTGATAATIGSAAWWSLAVNAISAAGANGGGAGGVNSGGSNATVFTGTTGGGGGAGSTASDNAGGGVVVASSLVPNVTGGAAGPNNGGAGLWLRESPFLPWSSTGGGGGGSTNTAGQTGGKGGDGAFGGGGGGGGAGVVAGGAGGRGGDAYMLLIAS